MIRQNWFDVKGDETLALDWPLTEDSHVWEIGGFEGRWAQQIWDKFRCNIRIFEPQYWAAEKMKTMFKENYKIDVCNYGLMVPPREFQWEVLPLGGYETDGASLYSDKEPVKAVSFRSIQAELSSFSYEVDLALMNIEGSEFFLIPHMTDTGLMSSFNYFWAQFHPGLVENGDVRYGAICIDMELTHEMIWDCYPHAVAWRRK